LRACAQLCWPGLAKGSPIIECQDRIVSASRCGLARLEMVPKWQSQSVMPQHNTSPTSPFSMQFATLCDVDSLDGWCEDHVTSHGAPYTMRLRNIRWWGSGGGGGGGCSPPPSAVQQRGAEAEAVWAYTLPTPRTRVKAIFHRRTPEVRDGPVRSIAALRKRIACFCSMWEVSQVLVENCN
jgi:hypothetical protein